uniref:Uncharacterized protein n=1 Tax=Candidatus Kentrum sp. FM TaxID=2126340 RepID=A0A450WN00_9GAMM|nr:MAG: hypothetical protein BECKFM1743C_GA0114222_105581 [Candidatus Kentron sp. FM]VFJ72048.1 MAG: hypothetical protein BECKFM1743A_GA0114220_106191 [Candidatus Kentron sp. FM]VFK18390.1 MAG: hypothetical protein BECKFM1743B_GA0114221_105431 [Candidatus Kentron sp. FM]
MSGQSSITWECPKILAQLLACERQRRQNKFTLLILSLLVDLCLLVHPDQLAQLNHRQLAFTVGSLIDRIKVDNLLTVIRDVLATERL